MSRKYKRRKTESVSSIPLNYKIVIVFGALVLIGLAYCFFYAQRQSMIRDTGYKMNVMRQEIQRSKNMNSNLRARLAEMSKLETITSKLNEYGIKLNVPRIEKVYRLKLYNGVEGLKKNKYK